MYTIPIGQGSLAETPAEPQFSQWPVQKLFPNVQPWPDPLPYVTRKIISWQAWTEQQRKKFGFWHFSLTAAEDPVNSGAGKVCKTISAAIASPPACWDDIRAAGLPGTREIRQAGNTNIYTRWNKTFQGNNTLLLPWLTSNIAPQRETPTPGGFCLSVQPAISSPVRMMLGMFPWLE